MLGGAGELAGYLSLNPAARAELIRVAGSTRDGGKRKVIVAAFRRLDEALLETFGGAMMSSGDWTARREGVRVIASLESLNADKALQIAYLLNRERHPAVASLRRRGVNCAA